MRKAYEMGFGKTASEYENVSLDIQGKIPLWIEGELIRNGPGTFRVGDEHYRHWFDGLAMLHKFSIKAGKVGYSNRFLGCKAYDQALQTGRIVFSEFATDPCDKLFHRLKTLFRPKLTDSAKVNVAYFDSRYLALGETPMQIEFDRKTLESCGVYQYDQNHMHVTTVHPYIDTRRGELYNLVIRFGRKSTYQLIRSTGKTSEPVARIKTTHPAYIHSFGTSPNYFILVEYPFRVYPLNILLSGKPFIENYRWQPERGTRFYVISRQNGKTVCHLETEPFFAFHHVNAFEKDDQLFIDLIKYPTAEIIESFYLDKIKSEKKPLPGGRLVRFSVDLLAGKLEQYELSDEDVELMRFDHERFNMSPDYNIVYSTGLDKKAGNSFYDQLTKINLSLHHSRIWHEKGCFPGEPVFVGKPGRTKEDQGVVMSVVLDENAGRSFLLILDAETFAELARVNAPHACLFGYHGEFFQDTEQL